MAAGGEQDEDTFRLRLNRKRPLTIARRRQAAALALAARRGVAALLALVLLTGLHVLRNDDSAQALAATLSAADSTQEAPDGQIIPMPFERPGGDFPGSAYYYLAADDAPAKLPAAGLHWDNDAGQAPTSLLTGPGPAARPTTIEAPFDRARALACLTAAVYYEAASEPDGGQRAVAQVVLNRVAHPSFPKTVCGVVFQGSELTTGCQFTFTCDGALARKPAPYFWNRAEAVARAALSGYVYAPVGLATHYHTFAVHPYWADKLDFLGQIGAHRFYRMEGPAGMAGAFRFAYAGGEPLPGVHQRGGADVTLADKADPLAQAHLYEDGLRLPAAPAPTAPDRAASPRAETDAAYRPDTPAPSTVRPEYRDSGRWIAAPR